MTKTCTDCGVAKEHDNFSKVSRNSDGLHNKCKTCYSAYMRKWQGDHRESVNARVLMYHHSNKKTANLKRRIRWASAGTEHNDMVRKAWESANLEKSRIIKKLARQKRRATKLMALTYRITGKDLAAILSRPCIYCGTSKNITLEHVIPLNRGGLHGIGNLAPACKSCNSAKKDRFIMEWKISKIQIGKVA